ncbi:MAG: transcription antitermination factor NusB [Defluviitaleaceae bacterium]|nr:transcription antitermination factor NusB [Defluviitaleaceae bacterium]
MSRRASRRHSFIITYQLEFYNEPDISQVFELYTEEFVPAESTAGISPEDSVFIKDQVYGVRENLEFIDSTITRYITGWSLARIAKVDLAILRLAIYELAFMPDIPTRVCINEAVELAKAYGDDDSPAFVNGLLASAQKEIRPDKL